MPGRKRRGLKLLVRQHHDLGWRFQNMPLAPFAALLKVPLVMAEPPGMTSADNSHPDPASAHDWSREFMTALAPHLRGLAGASAR